MKLLHVNDKVFRAEFRAIAGRRVARTVDITAKVREIIELVRLRGDLALREFVEKHDGLHLHPADFEVRQEKLDAALDSLPADQREALEAAAARIEDYHRRQVMEGFQYSVPPSAGGDPGQYMLGQTVLPFERVGVYAPGGAAPYPSSVLMNVVPAKVAGVKEIVLVSPVKERYSAGLYAAAKIAGVHRVFRMGGAHAIAALAYGTETIPRVQKIVGPGNVWVATAKKLVFGEVDIDMVAGPSEVCVIASEQNDPMLIAHDLLSQAEHDERAVCILVTPSEALARAVIAGTRQLLRSLARRPIAQASLHDFGAAIVTNTLDEAIELVNEFAPEHLEVLLENPREYISRFPAAGALFLGPYTPETVGDYIAGPNHVLPTGGSARFFSPLSVYEFYKRQSVMMFSRAGLAEVSRHLMTLTAMEGLEAHGAAVRYRMENELKLLDLSAPLPEAPAVEAAEEEGEGKKELQLYDLSPEDTRALAGLGEDEDTSARDTNGAGFEGEEVTAPPAAAEFPEETTMPDKIIPGASPEAGAAPAPEAGNPPPEEGPEMAGAVPESAPEPEPSGEEPAGEAEEAAAAVTPGDAPEDDDKPEEDGFFRRLIGGRKRTRKPGKTGE